MTKSNPEPAPIPRHVAIIMDGNGRWAQQRRLSRLAGHRAGTDNIRRVIQAFADHGIEFLTLYAFSTENWSRPRAEVRGLFRLLSQVIDRETENFRRQGVRICHLGRLEGLDPWLRQRVERALEATKDGQRMTVSIAFNYGGRAEIVDAVRRIVEAGLSAEAITEEAFAAYLYTADIPDPDLIIRTAGEMRLSNFLIWQAAYAEYYATPAFWPDFDEAEIEAALAAFAQRQRRFGALTPAPELGSKSSSEPRPQQRAAS